MATSGSFSSHLIEILIKAAGTDEAKRKLTETGAAGVAMNNKLQQSAKSTAKLYQGLAAATARVGSVIPQQLPLGGLVKDLTRATSASLGTANAMKGLGLDLGKVAIGAGLVVGGLLAVAAAASGLVAAVKAAGDSQEAILALGNAYRTLGINTTEAVGRATAFANAMQLVTKFTDEEILSTQALLAQLGRLSGTALEEATRATLDLAAGLGRELPVAALIMAKAAQGSTFELRKYGLVLDENIPATERWAAALKFVQTQFGGRAQSELKGFNATARQFSGALKDVLTLVGAPIVIPLTGALKVLTREMLDFTAARQQFQDTALLGGAPDIGRAFEDLLALEGKLRELQKQKQFPTDDPLAGVVNAEIEGQIRRTTDAIAEQKGVLQQTINEYARLGPVADAIRLETKLTLESMRARALYSDAVQDNADDIDALGTALQRATRIQSFFSETLQSRLELDAEAVKADLLSLEGSVRRLSESRETRLSFKTDKEFDEVERRVNELFKDDQFQLNLKAAGGADVLKEIEAIKASFKIALGSGNAEDIEEAVRELRERIIRDGLELDINKPATVAKVKELIDFVRSFVAVQAPIQIRTIVEAENVKQTLQIAENFFDRFVNKEGAQIFDPDQFKDVKTLPAVFDLLEEQLKSIETLSPKEVVAGYNLVAKGVSGIRFETAQAREEQEEFLEFIQNRFAPLAIQALEDVAGAEAIKGLQEKIPPIEAEIRLLIGQEKFDEARRRIEDLRAVVAELPPEITTVLLLKHDEYLRDLEEAERKAQDFSNELSSIKTIINLAIDVQQFDLAREKIAELKAKLKDVTDEERKIILELEIRKLEGELEKATTQVDEFRDNVTSQMESIQQGIESLPWEATGEIVNSAFDAMLDNTISVADAMAETFRNLVQDLIREAAKLAVLNLIFSSFGIPFGGTALTQLAQKPRPEKPRPEKPIPFKTRIGTGPEFGFAVTRFPQSFASAFARGEFATPRGGRPSRRVDIKIDALDASSIRRSLETGALGRELSRAAR